jgi:hypothetical protein
MLWFGRGISTAAGIGRGWKIRHAGAKPDRLNCHFARDVKAVRHFYETVMEFPPLQTSGNFIAETGRM